MSAAKGIPATRARPWYVKETWPAVVALAIGVLAGVFAVVGEVTAAAPNVARLASLFFLFMSALVLGAMKLAQSRYKDAKDDKHDSPDDLRGGLHVLYRALAGVKQVGDPPEGWLRLTIHRVDGDMLEQSVDYVGSNDGGASRRFRIQAGLIGKVARERPIQPRVFHRLSVMKHEEWLSYLVHDHAMTAEDAAKTRAGRYSFMGVPIEGPSGDVRAVVYLDAAEPDFFDEETKALVVNGCEGLADWTDEHYYRRRG